MTFRAFRALQIAPLALALCLASLAALTSPLRAEVPNGTQSDEASDLDALSRSTDDAKQGLALVREQTSLGDLTGALATLERVMINHPDSNDAQLLHASLLCRLDDRAGAQGEFASLRKGDFRGQAWKDANAPCQDAVAAVPPAATDAAISSGNLAGNAAGNTTGSGGDPGTVDKDAIRNENRRRRPGF